MVFVLSLSLEIFLKYYSSKGNVIEWLRRRVVTVTLMVDAGDAVSFIFSPKIIVICDTDYTRSK